MAVVAVFFETALVVLASIETSHRRKLFSYPVEKREYRISLGREIQLGIDVHIEIEIVAKRTIAV
jgi:hypothetical protein